MASSDGFDIPPPEYLLNVIRFQEERLANPYSYSSQSHQGSKNQPAFLSYSIHHPAANEESDPQDWDSYCAVIKEKMGQPFDTIVFRDRGPQESFFVLILIFLEGHNAVQVIEMNENTHLPQAVKIINSKKCAEYLSWYLQSTKNAETSGFYICSNNAYKPLSKSDMVNGSYLCQLEAYNKNEPSKIHTYLNTKAAANLFGSSQDIPQGMFISHQSDPQDDFSAVSTSWDDGTYQEMMHQQNMPISPGGGGGYVDIDKEIDIWAHPQYDLNQRIVTNILAPVDPFNILQQGTDIHDFLGTPDLGPVMPGLGHQP